MRIFFAPRSNETSYKNFLSTIENGIDYTIIETHLDEEGKKVLNSEDKIFAWGTKDSKKSSWDKLEQGDLVLFYKKGELVYAGISKYKQYSKDLGLSLWPPKPGEDPWTCVFFLDELKPVRIPLQDISDIAGYSKGFIVQGFMPLNEKGMEGIFKKFKSIDNFLKNYSVDASDKGFIEGIDEISSHEEAELLLLKIGQQLGFQTYTPDKNKAAFGEELSKYIDHEELPIRFIGEQKDMVKEIDVIWFKEEVPKYAFEVEHSTRMSNGFQRLFQLSPLGTNLFLISAEKHRKLFNKFLNSSPFYKSKESFSFKNYKQLENFFSHVDEFSAIRKTFLGKVNG